MKVVFCIAVGIVLCGATTAQAALYEFTFEGQIISITGEPVPSPWDMVQIGSPHSFSYIFDSKTPDLVGHPFTGLYDFISLDVTIDGITQSTTSGEIRVIPNTEYSIFATDLPIGAAASIEFLNPLFGVLPTDELPLDLDLSEWLAFQLEVVGTGGAWRIGGDIQSFHGEIVPTPSVLVVIGFGLLGRRRRRSRNP